ncbi:HAMP domain-containing sensor histidine kinase [Roseimicrobium sp. ORNL1]|uniref:sensor histidine kinase n=1 Tax=Roseimicrobium sp. ORNL1 TaxID=2711231 RepID=UPI0013E16824|nr:HAMP domain-containing sensor histidine kinase [Roseimicrobium sp. ORNL1]QIF00042.1 HAMP domain-containing histidine kinase [Roseimicrobium sp. ORNL1]
MTPGAPRLTLMLLLFTAACIMAGGAALSRREEVVRVPQDRAPLKQLATALQKELLRLEALHEKHLEGMVTRVTMSDTFGTQQACGEIAGVVACSFLLRSTPREEHVRLARIPAGKYALPTFESPSLNRSDLRLLDKAAFTKDDAPQEGWLEDPAWPLMYWSRGPGNWIVFVTIEPKEVQTAVDGWIKEWLLRHPEFHEVLEGQMELVTPSGTRLGGAATPSGDESPHWSQSLVTRYGSWQLASWDRMETSVVYHLPTLVVAGLLSILVALLGVAVFVQQRRAHRLAMQRVSFVNRVSHELRTPLTNMLLNLDIIEDSLPHEGRAASRLALVREEAGRLARLIANVLTFSRREQGSLKLRPVACCPAQVVDAVVDQFAPSFARHGITVIREDGADDTPCGLDPDALSQITANLLSNVEKYAPGAPVQISTQREGNDFVLTVHDGGPGVSAADATRVFEPFVRLDDRVAAGVTGTGLGLSIARELAQRMGGSLELGLPSDGNNDAKGACFVLRVPVVDPPKKGDSGPGNVAMVESTSSVPSPSQSQSAPS